MPTLSQLDHFVLAVADIARTCAFYEQVLGMRASTFNNGTRYALHFGQQKINLHPAADEQIAPKAAYPTAGSADVCFITTDTIEAWVAHLAECGVEIIAGPIVRTGAQGAILSIYLHDPDQNLIEIARYQE